MSFTKGTKYFGFDNVPSGVLVKGKNRLTGRREFFLKTEHGTQAWLGFRNGGPFVFVEYNPDDFMTGTYKAMS